MDRNTTNSIRATFGVQGSIGSSPWKYSVDMTYTENKLTEETHLAFEDAINNFFAPIYGPNLGVDPDFGVNTYTPNYAAFYQPLTPAQYASFNGYATSRSRTEDSLGRVQLTNSDLFRLPGGNAGVAVVGEGGRQGWAYDPDPRYLNGGTYLYTATSGDGHRTRYAGTGELRLPVLPMLTFDLSGRYDDYKVSDENVDKATYNIGVEFRPITGLLLRGRYGTAFKAPTLADEFQGSSGFFQTATDYYSCAQRGYSGATLANCPYAQESIFGTTSGNPALRPINAKVWDLGVVFSPFSQAKISLDWLHWKITDEVQPQVLDQLLKTEAACQLGQLDATSPTCLNAFNQVQRDPATGLIDSVSTPKVNVASEVLSVMYLNLEYTLATAYAGDFTLQGSYTNNIKHESTQFSGDTPINLLQSPFYSTEFKTKENVSLTWSFKKLQSTVYVERYGRTPNYLATLSTDGYSDPGTGRVGTWTLVNLSAAYEVLKGLAVSFNVNNVANKMPPVDNSYTGILDQPYNSLNYNPYGRTFFVEAQYKFSGFRK